ncbi:hypothetical protein JAAARDRAFT_610185 [Jaapia argillacea MUCL 33604]|uniref:Uncharacterized protein n=1 Tax=Jaapia argillacea MUCL 33604 TaxID=933084 RepID=A0A067P555_9AGAM|nr:hypothetical protein JAAARDRAFT_610185 [Jaapia argillacea MUCL 33604]
MLSHCPDHLKCTALLFLLLLHVRVSVRIHLLLFHPALSPMSRIIDFHRDLTVGQRRGLFGGLVITGGTLISTIIGIVQSHHGLALVSGAFSLVAAVPTGWYEPCISHLIKLTIAVCRQLRTIYSNRNREGAKKLREEDQHSSAERGECIGLADIETTRGGRLRARPVRVDLEEDVTTPQEHGGIYTEDQALVAERNTAPRPTGKVSREDTLF